MIKKLVSDATANGFHVQETGDWLSAATKKDVVFNSCATLGDGEERCTAKLTTLHWNENIKPAGYDSQDTCRWH